MRSGAILGVAVLVAGCSKPAPEQPKRAPVAPQQLNLARNGWPAVFADAQHSLDLFGRIGLRPGAYEKVGNGYRSTATRTAMSDPSGAHPAMADFIVNGGPRTLDRIEFSLDESAQPDTVARAQFVRWVGQALSQLGVAGSNVVLPALSAARPAQGSVAGAIYAIDTQPVREGHRLSVAFTRADTHPR